MVVDESVPKCPKCGCTALLLLRTLNEKRCGNKDCRTTIPWFLDDGQKPLIKYQR